MHISKTACAQFRTKHLDSAFLYPFIAIFWLHWHWHCTHTYSCQVHDIFILWSLIVIAVITCSKVQFCCQQLWTEYVGPKIPFLTVYITVNVYVKLETNKNYIAFLQLHARASNPPQRDMALTAGKIQRHTGKPGHTYYVCSKRPKTEEKVTKISCRWEEGRGFGATGCM